MQILENKTDEELLQSLIAEAAKCTNEIKCAQSDLDKASNRLRFMIVVINTLLDRSSTN